MRARTSVRRAGGAFLVAAALTTTIAACGGSDGAPKPQDVAAGDVARVADQGISKGRFDRALLSRVRGISPLSPGTASAPLDAPGFRRCVAAQRRAVRDGAAKDAVLPDTAQLKADCAARYQQARAATMTALIRERWILEQAAAQHIEVPPSTVATTLEQYAAATGLRRDGTPLPAAQARARFDADLRRSGLTRDDLRAQLTAQLAQSQLQQKLLGSLTTRTAAQARRAQRLQVEAQAALATTWRPRTLCAKGYVVAECGNAPAPAETATTGTPATTG